jgi:hypothetical protein
MKMKMRRRRKRRRGGGAGEDPGGTRVTNEKSNSSVFWDITLCSLPKVN